MCLAALAVSVMCSTRTDLDHLPEVTKSLTLAAFFIFRDKAVDSFKLITQLCSIDFEEVQRIVYSMKISPGMS